MNFHPAALRDVVFYGASFAAQANIAAATNETVVAPASNTGGMIVWGADIFTVQTTAAAGSLIALIAKSSAPTAGTDGEVLLICGAFDQTAAGLLSALARCERPVYVAAGKGLYFRNSGAGESVGYRSVRYTLLS